MEFKISDKMRNMKPSIIREILKQMSAPTLISFAGGNPAADSFPAEDIARFSDELLRQDPVAALQYSVSEGVPSVREAVRAFANRRERVAKENDGVLITSGSQQILDFAAKCLCNEGDVVAVENPAFLGAFNAFRSSGARLAGVPMEDDGVNLAALEAVFAAPEKPRFFYCIPNFQNPTGKTMSLAKRRAVYALAVRYGVPVLEDDPYGELRIAGGQFFQNFVPGHAPCVLRLRQKADGRLCGGEAVQRRAHQRVGAACMRGHADAHGYGRAHPGDTQNLRGQGGADDGTAG